jgi:tetratricopeptide (TPR) repeat protein
MKRPVTPRQMWKRLLRAWNKGPACQLEMAKQYTTTFPDLSEGWIVLADGLAGVARYREAQVALRRASRLSQPDRRWFIAVQWGHLFRERHDPRSAERWYRKAVARHPTTSTHIFLGGTLAKQGKFAEAKRHHKRAIKLATDMQQDAPDEAHYNLGLILRAQGRYEEAVGHLTKAIEIDPKYKIAKEALQDVHRAMRFRKGAQEQARA